MKYKEENIIDKNTLVSPDRRVALYELLKSTNHLPGVNVEVGVYKGGTALLIAANSDKPVHLFDTFTGLPKPNENDNHHEENDFNDVSYEQVQELLKNYPNAHLYKGLFPQDTGSLIENEQFSFVYLDVDLYSSTKDCLEFFYPKMVKGGIIVTDDYGWKFTDGVKTAWDEFMKNKPEQTEQAATIQAHIVKV